MADCRNPASIFMNSPKAQKCNWGKNQNIPFARQSSQSIKSLKISPRKSCARKAPNAWHGDVLRWEKLQRKIEPWDSTRHEMIKNANKWHSLGNWLSLPFIPSCCSLAAPLHIIYIETSLNAYPRRDKKCKLNTFRRRRLSCGSRLSLRLALKGFRDAYCTKRCDINISLMLTR